MPCGGIPTNLVEVSGLTDDEINEVMELIDSTTGVYTYDVYLYNIMVEECEAFFKDEKRADKTAKNIQSQISQYMSENR